MPSETDPFHVLGVPSSADEQALRAAFRAMALRHHPDRNPDDPEAPDRFKRVMHAYRSALRALRGERGPERRWEPPPGRWSCPGCGDRFVVQASCPRCEREPIDRGGLEARAPHAEVRLDPWAAALEQRPLVTASEPSRVAPAVMALVFMLTGALIAQLGPIAPAVMFGAFGLWIILLEAHARLRVAASPR